MLNVFAVVVDCGAEKGGGIAVAPNELCRRCKGEVEHVVEYKDLAVTVRTGADANGGDGKFCGDFGCDFARNAFEDEEAGPGFSEGVRIGLELGDCFGGAGHDSHPCGARSAA